MHRVRLFAYGTLLDEKIQRRVFGRTVASRSARLTGWRVLAAAVRGRYPGIVCEAARTTTGAVLRLDRRELAKADTYECTPKLYRRVRVTVQSEGRRQRAWVYVPAGVGLAGVARGRRPRLAWRR